MIDTAVGTLQTISYGVILRTENTILDSDMLNYKSPSNEINNIEDALCNMSLNMVYSV
jgi:hypothetical protein